MKNRKHVQKPDNSQVKRDTNLKVKTSYKVHYRLITVKTKEPRVISTIEVVNLNIHTHLKVWRKK